MHYIAKHHANFYFIYALQCMYKTGAEGPTACLKKEEKKFHDLI